MLSEAGHLKAYRECLVQCTERARIGGGRYLHSDCCPLPVECFGTCAILRGSIEYYRCCVNHLELDSPRHPPIICKDGVPVERSDAINAALEREEKT